MPRALRFALIGLLALASSAFAADPNADAIPAARRVAQQFLGAIDARNEALADDMLYTRATTHEPSGRVSQRPAVSASHMVELRRPLGHLLSRTLVKTEAMKESVQFTYETRYERRDAPVKELLTIKTDHPQRGTVISFHLVP